MEFSNMATMPEDGIAPSLAASVWAPSPTAKGTLASSSDTIPDDGAMPQESTRRRGSKMRRQHRAVVLQSSIWAPAIGRLGTKGKNAAHDLKNPSFGKSSGKIGRDRDLWPPYGNKNVGNARLEMPIGRGEPALALHPPPVQVPRQQAKRYRVGPVGRHEIVDHWNKGVTGPLVSGIISQLAGFNWTTLNLFRIESAPNESFNGCIALLIGVRSSSITDTDTECILSRCIRTLRQHSFSDVHCLVQASSLIQHANAPIDGSRIPSHVPSPRPQMLSILGHSGDQSDVQESERLGAAISVARTGGYGTKGMYLNLTDKTGTCARVALTCRHVAVPDTYDETQEFDGLGNSQVISISQLSTLQLKGERQLGELNDIIVGLDKLGSSRPLSHDEQLKKKSTQLVVDAIQPRLDQLRSLPRIIGKVAYAPPIEVASPTTKPWIRDWAIMTLEPKMHATELAGLPNHVSVFVSQTEHHEIQKSLKADHLDSIPLQDILCLRGIVPEAEIWQARDYRSLLLAKYGARTGLTLGISNKAMAVSRYVVRGVEKVVREWAILGLTDCSLNAERSRSDFSASGDSGSCVFDAKTGRIAGMLTGGEVWGKLPGRPAHVVGPVDVTYVTPIETLLDDIGQSLAPAGFKVCLP